MTMDRESYALLARIYDELADFEGVPGLVTLNGNDWRIYMRAVVADHYVPGVEVMCNHDLADGVIHVSVRPGGPPVPSLLKRVRERVNARGYDGDVALLVEHVDAITTAVDRLRGNR